MTNYYIKLILFIYFMVQCSVQQVIQNNSVVSPTGFYTVNEPTWDIVDDTAVVNEPIFNGNPWISLWQNLFQATTSNPAGGAGSGSNSGGTVQQEEENCLKCRCGITNTAKRIVGGTETQINEYPWMGLITFGSRLHCGSSVINDRYLLTAAHCVKGYNLKRFTVTLLEHDRLNTSESQTVKFRVESGMVHPHYNESTFDNDIAILRLDKIIKFNNKLRPVCLPRPRLTFAGSNGIVTGWGDTSEDGYDSNTLQEVEVPILSNKECRETGYGESRITDNMLCAGVLAGGKDSCQGDSGGPLHVGKNNIYQIAGIVSFGDGCAEPDYPGVYTRVNRYSSWIGTNTFDACYCDN